MRIEDAIKKLAGDARGNTVFWTLSKTSDAAEAIEAASLPPGLKQRAFMLLLPTEPLFFKADTLYRAHVEEILSRLARGEDTRPGTDAECLGFMSDLSLKAPLNVSGLATTMHLFNKLYPGTAVFEAPKAFYAGQIEESIAELRRKLARPDRRI